MKPELTFFDPIYYSKRVNRDFPSPAAAQKHFQTVGETLNIGGNAFLHPELMKLIEPDVKNFASGLTRTVRKFTGALGPLVDQKWVERKYSVGQRDVPKFVLQSVNSSDWFNFHPLLTEMDYRRSKFQRLNDWIQVLSDPYQSLQGYTFSLFSPDYYRKTATDRRLENELLDYLIYGDKSGGIPHVFCDYWYAKQFDDTRELETKRGDSWLDFAADWGAFGSHVSPFFDPFWFNQQHMTKFGESNLHPLEKFSGQSFGAIMPHKDVVPSALAYAFSDIPLKDCHPDKLDAAAILSCLETALTHTSETVDSPRVSVCMLNYNKPAHSILASIAASRHSDGTAEILVLDNGSQPKDFETILRYTRRCGDIKTTRSLKNLYFGEGNNILIDQSVGEYVLMLNNDAYVGDGTISRFVKHLDGHSRAAACGGTFLFPNLSIQEAGGYVSDCGQQLQLRKHAAFKPYYENYKSQPDFFQNTDYISSACFCVRKDILDELGGYDLAFEPLYFEDTDLCRRITSAGYEIHHIPSEYIIHFENASTREFLGSSFMKQIQKNRLVFRNRWMFKPDGYRPRSIPAALMNDPNPDRPSAVIYTPYQIAIGGGERYILSVAAALAGSHNVTVITPDFTSRTRVAFTMQELGIALSDNMVIQVGNEDDMLQMSRPDLFIAMGNEAIPPVPMIGKMNVFHCQFPFPAHHMDRSQVARLRNVDAIFVNSEYTKAHMQSRLNTYGFDCPVHVTYAPVNSASFAADDWIKPPLKKGLSILNVGRFDPDGHSKRQDIALDIFKLFSKSNREGHLTFVGGMNTSEARMAYLESLRTRANENVDFKVNAPRDELGKYFQSANVYLHACGFGEQMAGAPEKQEHFGITVVEGMAAGLIPVVFNGGGPAEIVKNAGVGYVYQSVEEAASILERLSKISNQEHRIQSQMAISAAEKYSDEAFRNRVRSLVNSMVTSG